jgi:hypothetical protein
MVPAHFLGYDHDQFDNIDRKTEPEQQRQSFIKLIGDIKEHVETARFYGALRFRIGGLLLYAGS